MSEVSIDQYWSVLVSIDQYSQYWSVYSVLIRSLSRARRGELLFIVH